MKYFRPELFQRTNSPDPDAALAASDEWEAAARAYRRRLKALRKKLPESVNTFVATVGLHDCEVFGLNLQRPDARAFGLDNQTATLFARHPDGVVVLSYQLDSEPGIEYNRLPPGLASQSRLWLYDEFDLSDVPTSSQSFTHRIFLSDGVLIEFRFTNFAFKVFPAALPGPRSSHAGRRGDRLVSV